MAAITIQSSKMRGADCCRFKKTVQKGKIRLKLLTMLKHGSLS
jgi:hypothetical protein